MPFQIIRNDITKVKADVIVNTANPKVVIGSGVDTAIYNAAGRDKLFAEREKIGPIERGDVAITPAFGLDVNQYIDNHTKFYNTDYDDLMFEYTITNVVFADGSAKDPGTEEETALTASEVEIVVTEKTNLEENYRAGRYSPRVEFTFAVTNNTDKDIRGIQGSLIIMDLFGKEITTIGCDFTGETFVAGETKTISGLGIDINQYIDAEAKLYNEDFTDLQFKYEVKQIVYK